jgi:hypothetical protein
MQRSIAHSRGLAAGGAQYHARVTARRWLCRPLGLPRQPHERGLRVGERNQSLWAALLLIFSGTDSAAGDLTHYQVVFEQNNMSEATVEAEVTITDRKLRMASWGHPHLPRGWATFVSGLKISDLNGVAVDFVEDTEETWGAWLVEAEDGTRLNLQYTVEFSQSEYDWSEAG